MPPPPGKERTAGLDGGDLSGTLNPSNTLLDRSLVDQIDLGLNEREHNVSFAAHVLDLLLPSLKPKSKKGGIK